MNSSQQGLARTTTVRVRSDTRDRLARIGERRGLSTPDLLEQLSRRAEEEDLLDAANAHFATTVDERRTEIAAWDDTAADGMSSR